MNRTRRTSAETLRPRRDRKAVPITARATGPDAARVALSSAVLGVALLVAPLLTGTAFGDEASGDEPAAIAATGLTVTSTDAAAAAAESVDLEAIRERVAATLPGLTLTSIAETPVPTLFELVVDGQIYYVNESADYLFDGSLIELGTRTNLTENRLGGIQSSLIEEIGEENMLIYEPDEPSERSLTVFTDISCGFCRRLHEDIDVLLDAGVRVRYLLFPRAGLGSPGHQELESVWCADDPLAAMTTAKAGGRVPEANCENPIEAHMAVAERIGLRGTPLIYLDSGERIPGYREPAELAAMVGGSRPLRN